MYSYISIINKCGLDINLKNYIYSNLDFSSINLPEVDQDNTLKQSLILGGIKQKKKEELKKAIENLPDDVVLSISFEEPLRETDGEDDVCRTD